MEPSDFKCVGVTRPLMLKGEKKEIDEKDYETMVKTYGVHLASIRLPGIAILSVFRKAGISQ